MFRHRTMKRQFGINRRPITKSIRNNIDNKINQMRQKMEENSHITNIDMILMTRNIYFIV